MYLTEAGQARPQAPAARNVLHEAMEGLLREAEYRRCESGDDFEAVARLRFDAYRSVGMVDERPDCMLVDRHDSAPNGYTYAVMLGGRLAGTVRFHRLSPEHPHSPSMDNFPESLGPRIERGDSFIDPSRFAADPVIAGQVRALPHLILKIVVSAALHFGATSTLSLVQGNHGAFYRRVFGSTLLGGPKRIPPLTIEASLYEALSRTRMEEVFRRFPFFKTTPEEAAALLGFQQAA